jgi:hypothetical protein
MALVTAKQYGIHPDIITRAEEIKREIQSQSKKVASILFESSRSSSSSIISSTTESPLIVDSSTDSTTIFQHSGGGGGGGRDRNVTRYDLERDILPAIRSFIPDFNPAMVEINYNPPVSFEGHNCVYVLLFSNTDNEVRHNWHTVMYCIHDRIILV